MISAVVGLLLASQISASAATTKNGFTVKKAEKFVVSVVAGGVGVVTTATKLAGDYAVDHPAKAAAKTAPIVAVLYAPIVPGVGFVLTAVGVAKSLAKWFKR